MHRQPLVIYLISLSHVHSGIVSTESIPLNIGYLGAYLNKMLGESVKVSLFNIPEVLERAVKERPPDILCTGNYIWNSSLNYYYLSYYKEKYPFMTTVMGGPTYPGSPELQEDFLRKRSAIDFYIYREGETALYNLVKFLIEYNNTANVLKGTGTILPGCHYVIEDNFCNGGEAPRIHDLDLIPSPYLTGLFDRMLTEGFVPVFQTNRGCPYSCAYCHSGGEYYNRVAHFSLERSIEELEYIGRLTTSFSMYMTDDNFGLFKKDKEIAHKIAECRKKFQWPLRATIATSKENKKRTADCVKPLEDLLLFSASVQSTNEQTLKEIGRKNISYDGYMDIITDLTESGIASDCEFIFGLPMETLDSFLKGIKWALDIGVKNINIYTCMILKSTPLDESQVYEKFSLLKRYRIIPRNFGRYLGKIIVEKEEVTVTTQTVSMEDYLFVRGFFLIITSCYNRDNFKEIIKFLKKNNINIYDFLLKLYFHLKEQNGVTGLILKSFLEDTENELWLSEGHIDEFINLEGSLSELEECKVGANLIQKYSAVFYENHNYLAEDVKVVVNSLFGNNNHEIIRELIEFSKCLRGNIFDTSKVIEKYFKYDVLSWYYNQSDIKAPQLLSHPIKLRFFTTNEKKTILEKHFKQYGTETDNKGKILTRIDPQTLYKKVQIVQKKEAL